MKYFGVLCLAVSLASLWMSVASAENEPRVVLTDLDASCWSCGPDWKLASGESLEFRFPDGPLGMVKRGFRVYHDGTRDWQNYAGLEMDLQAAEGREVELEWAVIAPPELHADERTAGKVRFTGSGSRFLSWDTLEWERARSSWKNFVRGIDLKLRYTDGRGGDFQVKSMSLLKAPAVSLEAEVKGKSVKAGEAAVYEITVSNPLEHAQSVVIYQETYGWQSMTPTIEPSEMVLQPGESRACKVSVRTHENTPPGGHETQTLVAVADGRSELAQRLKLVTGVEVPPPYILHTPARWQEVRDKVATYDWARREQERFVNMARKWEVPEAALKDPDDTWGPYLFPTQVEHNLMASGIAWQLTGDKSYAEKVAKFLQRLSDPESGYPKTWRACNQSQVQEGHFFQHVAMAYDMVRDAGVISEELKTQLEVTLRMHIETMARRADGGPINNWNVAEVTGAFYGALVMQDLSEADRFFSGPAGICDQMRYGVMDDGWWYECSISYNTWVAREFCQVALAYEPWGVNFRDMHLPPTYSGQVMLRAELNGGSAYHPEDKEQLKTPFGIDGLTYGPNTKPYRRIRDMWDSLIPFLDWRGVMFGVNDSTEHRVVGETVGVSPVDFEVAYYVYRDPRYASVIKRGGSRDLLYGVPELPENTPEPFRENAAADNVGLVMLRSQTPDRPIREQIQSVIHYGTHGWAHGHFDRTNLLSLMRYGRSFYNPEAVWHSYEPFMYKFYVQTSLSHNMVVVDRKMQKATPGKRLLFHTGGMMQATAVEATAPWSNPPYGGMVYDYVPVNNFEEKTWREGRHVPIPETGKPNYGEITGYTEPIQQRRAMLVADDYVLLVDSVRGDVPHDYENLFQMKGFKGIEAAEKKFLRHDAQWDTDPLGSAQFVTDCDWYQVKAPALSRFEMKFGPDADNAGTRALYSEDGLLKLDVHTLWPPEQEIMFGTVPENHGLGQRLFYTVKGDGRILSEGRFGAWTLGKGDIDVPLDGVKRLELETRVELKKRPTLFWGSARVVTADGREIPLAELSPNFENVKPVESPGLDYDGGPVKIQGEHQAYSTPAQPADDSQVARVWVDLSGIRALRFKSAIGSDFPPGPEAERRKTMSVKAPKGRYARFITVIEPYEAEPVVKSAKALSESEVRVELMDGRVQRILIDDFDGKLGIDMVETKDGREIRHESTR